MLPAMISSVNIPPLELFLNYVFLYLRGCTTLKGAAMMDAFLKKYREEAGRA